MYEPPIEIVQHTIRDAIDKHIDDCVYKAVVRTDIHVDREELIKALQYDRDQFQKGFAAGVEWGSPKWISVEDSLPEAEKEVLGWRENYACIIDYGYLEGGMCFYFYDDCGYPTKAIRPSVTHWMPLPEAPKEE